MNVAVTDSPELIVTVHDPVPEHPAPVQPANDDPAAGVAFSVTCEPCETLTLQVPGQVIPPPDTEPDPGPARETCSVSCAGGFAVNVAVTDSPEFIVAVHDPVPEHPAPDQPANDDPPRASRSA